MGYRVYYNFSDGTSEDLLDEVFSTKKEAQYAASEGAGNYAVGTETLYLGGHDYSEAKIIDWDIVEE